MSGPQPRRTTVGGSQGAARRAPGDERQFVRQKKAGAHPAVVIGVFGVLAMVAIWFVFVLMQREETIKHNELQPPVVTTDDEFAEITKRINGAMLLKQDAMRLKVSDDVDVFRAKCEEAKKALGDVIEELDDMLEPTRDELGQIKDEYSGYNVERQKLNQALYDLIKISPL